MSLLLPGSGHFYTGQSWTGWLFVFALAGLLGLLPVPFGIAAYIALGGASAWFAIGNARKINQYLKVRRETERALVPYPPEYKLLAAMRGAGRADFQGPVISGSEDDPLITALYKLRALHLGGIISATELRERKVDLLSELTDLSRQQMDELLFQLLRLREGGVVEHEDVEFLKQLRASQ
jgi:hypothetical protein